VSADVYRDFGDFALCPSWVYEADISAQAVRLYLVLWGYADRRTNVAHPSRKTLADKIRVSSVRTVDAAIDDLERIGALQTFARPDPSGAGDRSSNGYRLIARGGAADCTTPVQQIAGGVVQQTAHEQEPVEQEPVNKSRRGTRLPDDWFTEDMRDFARAEGLSDQQIARLSAEFTDYWRAVPGQKGVKLDWLATWRNNIRRKLDRGLRPEGRTPLLNGTKIPAGWS
jgi:hypothetical protein